MQPRRLGDLFSLFFNPSVPILFVGTSIVLAVLGNAVFALLLKQLGDTKQTLVEIVTGALLIFIALTAGFWMLLRAWRPPASIELPLEQQAEPHAGLVLLVSEGQQKSERAAITFHHRSGTLNACWLVATPQSQTKASELSEWVRGLGVQPFVLVLPDAFQSRLSYTYVSNAIRQAQTMRDGLPVIVDITGGTKPMTAGAVLACRDHGVLMQYMRTVLVNGEPVVRAQPEAMKVESVPA